MLLLLTAAPPTIVLRHSAVAAEACPDESWVREAVTSRLGRSPFVDSGAPVATTKVSCTARTCSAELRFTERGEDRVRNLTGRTDDCRELMESLALALALSIDPLLLTRPAPAPPSPPEVPPVAPPPVEPVKEVKEPAPEPPSRPVEPPTRVDLQATIGGLGSVGPTPHVGGGGVVGAAFGFGRFQLWLEGQLEAAHVTPVAAGTVTSQVLLARLAPCLRLGGWALCGTVSAGALQVAGALPQGLRSSSPLLLAGARVSWSYFFLDWLGLRVHAELQAVVTRTTVLALGEPLWVTFPLAGHLGGSALIRF